MDFKAFEERGIEYDHLDDRTIHFDLDYPVPWLQYAAVLERSISYTSGLYALRMLNSWGIPTVNTAAVAETCGDKLLTSALLNRHGVPQPHNAIAFTPESALEVIRSFGYPVVLKPSSVLGRLLAKINGRDAAEAYPSINSRWGPFSTPCFISEFIPSPVVISGLRSRRPVLLPSAARPNIGLRTLTRGGVGEICPLTPRSRQLSLQAAKEQWWWCISRRSHRASSPKV
jgi:[lysine-biosynthesis-protein LysW]--L-2-aminoadipate ligase